jgi:hypothetical protein
MVVTREPTLGSSSEGRAARALSALAGSSAGLASARAEAGRVVGQGSPFRVMLPGVAQ